MAGAGRPPPYSRRREVSESPPPDAGGARPHHIGAAARGCAMPHSLWHGEAAPPRAARAPASRAPPPPPPLGAPPHRRILAAAAAAWLAGRHPRPACGTTKVQSHTCAMATPPCARPAAGAPAARPAPRLERKPSPSFSCGGPNSPQSKDTEDLDLRSKVGGLGIQWRVFDDFFARCFSPCLRGPAGVSAARAAANR